MFVFDDAQTGEASDDRENTKNHQAVFDVDFVFFPTKWEIQSVVMSTKVDNREDGETSYDANDCNGAIFWALRQKLGELYDFWVHNAELEREDTNSKFKIQNSKWLVKEVLPVHT